MSHRVERIADVLALNRDVCEIKNFGGIVGASVTLLLNKDNFLDKDILEDGIFEPELSEFLRRSIKPGMTCADVGANFGYFSIPFTLCGARTLAFEPSVIYRRLWLRNLRLNGVESVVVCDRAHSDHSRHADMHIGVCSGTIHQVPGNVARNVEKVEPYKFDDIVKERVDLLKVDTDGHDMSVLRGAVSTIRNDRPSSLSKYRAATITSPARI